MRVARRAASLDSAGEPGGARADYDDVAHLEHGLDARVDAF